MANLFETPIAAKPMSEFVALPLQFIDQTLQRRQARYDKARSSVDEAEDAWLKSKALPGDMARNRQLISEQEQKIDDLVEAAGDDYSLIQAPLDRITRNIKRSMNYGELGAQKIAYESALKQQDEYRKLLQQSKIQQSGYDSFVKSISKHVTRPTAEGGFSRFSGYSPSNVVDPTQHISDAADEINAKYDEEGQRFVDADTILNSISHKLKSNPNIIRSIKENYLASFTGSPSEAEKGFQGYYEDMIKRVVQEKAYMKYNTVREGGTRTGKTLGGTFHNFQLPNISGEFEYSGASMARGKDWVNKLLGLNTTEEFEKSIATPESKKRIRYIEQRTGEDFPTTFYEQQEWIKNHAGTPKVQSLVTRDALNSEIEQRMTKEGLLKNPTVGLYNQDGSAVTGKQMRDRMGKNADGRVARVLGIVSAGGTYPIGSAIIQGKDGALMVQPPTDTKTLQSAGYALWKINKVKMTNTGAETIKLDFPLSSNTGKFIPAGVYQTSHDIADKSAYPNSVVLSQNGTPKYIVTQKGELKIL